MIMLAAVHVDNTQDDADFIHFLLLNPLHSFYSFLSQDDDSKLKVLTKQHYMTT